MIKEKMIDNSLVGKRSIQSMPFTWLGSSDFGRIVPFHVQELMPTDKVVTCNPRIEMQMLPLASPTFGELSIYVHYFFVPYRLVWEDANDVFSKTGAGQNNYAPCAIPGAFCALYNNSQLRRPIYKHLTSLGLPPFFTVYPYSSTGLSRPISLLPLRAYRRIFWDFYRDPELISDASESEWLDKSSGLLSSVPESLCLPLNRMVTDTWHAQCFANRGVSPNSSAFAKTSPINNLGSSYSVRSNDDTSKNLRTIEALTRIAERFSLSGKRQIDQLFSQYGVKPEFSKLSMCQYVGGGKADVLISDITATADTITPFGETTTGAPLGMKAGAGYAALDSINIDYEASEHGVLMGVFSVMPKVHFVQGIGRQWHRQVADDFFRKELEHTGLIAIPRSEVAMPSGGTQAPDYNPAEDELTYAFQQPYYEYTRNQDILAGDFMWYHYAVSGSQNEGDIVPYMQSMENFVDFGADNGSRNFVSANLTVHSLDFNKIFYYLGGNSWDDSDDHFHVRFNVNVKINRPMDGFAVPTIETTEDPHASQSALPTSTTL